jgi:hypothetical protein
MHTTLTFGCCPSGPQHTHAGMMYVRRGLQARRFFELAQHANKNYWDLGFRPFKAGSKALEIHWSYAFGQLGWQPLDFYDQDLFAFNWGPGEPLPTVKLFPKWPITPAEKNGAYLYALNLSRPRISKPAPAQFHGYCHVHMFDDNYHRVVFQELRDRHDALRGGAHARRLDCGHPGISEAACLRKGCEFDNWHPDALWCYKLSNP